MSSDTKQVMISSETYHDWKEAGIAYFLTEGAYSIIFQNEQ